MHFKRFQLERRRVRRFKSEGAGLLLAIETSLKWKYTVHKGTDFHTDIRVQIRNEIC